MNTLSKDLILAELSKIKLNDGQDVTSSGIVSSIIIREGNVGFVLTLEKNSRLGELEIISKNCEDAIYKIPGVNKVTAVITNEHNEFGTVKVEAKSAPKGGVAPPTPKPVAGIKKIIAVASGKGGVGKSTIAAHLALAYAQTGKKTGLVDADILGPSVAKMMGVSGQPIVKNDKMIPPEKHGVKCMSMGLMMGENTPVVWRGPMVTKALHQLMLSADWGELDVLVMDLPPGTGDIQLSLAQNYKIDGVILVSTPQEVALLDVKKAATMFIKLNIPIIGILENMSYFEDPAGAKHHLFGTGAVEKFCNDTGIKLLGQVPVLPQISKGCDEGIEIKNNTLVEKLSEMLTAF